MIGSLVDTNVIIKMLHNEKEALDVLEKIDKAYITVIVAAVWRYALPNIYTSLISNESIFISNDTFLLLAVIVTLY
jgi:predicted nucleic acid-binding protein